MTIKVGDEIQFPPVTRDQIADYADASGDRNPIHLDADFAKAAGFSDVIAHGMLSMGLVGLALKKWNIEQLQIKSFETKFKEVVNLGDSLRVRVSKVIETQLELDLINQSNQLVCSSRICL